MQGVKFTAEAREGFLKYVYGQVAIGRAVSRILREDDGMPAASVFWDWVYSDPEASEKLARAREQGVEARLDEIEEIADDHEIDVKRARLMVDTRLKLAAMIAPRRYGAKLDLTSGGEKLPANQVTQTKVDALIALGVDKAIRHRQKQLPAPEEKEDGE